MSCPPSRAPTSWMCRGCRVSSVEMDSTFRSIRICEDNNTQKYLCFSIRPEDFFEIFFCTFVSRSYIIFVDCFLSIVKLHFSFVMSSSIYLDTHSLIEHGKKSWIFFFLLPLPQHSCRLHYLYAAIPS